MSKLTKLLDQLTLELQDAKLVYQKLRTDRLASLSDMSEVLQEDVKIAQFEGVISAKETAIRLLEALEGEGYV